MNLSNYSPKLDKFDKLMKAKAADFLSSDEVFFGAVKLRPIIDASMGIDLKGLGKQMLIETIFGEFISSLSEASELGSEVNKSDSRFPVMVVTNKKILFVWNSVEISHLFNPIAELSPGTTIEFKRRYAMTIGSSKFKVRPKDLKKLKGLVRVTVSK